AGSVDGAPWLSGGSCLARTRSTVSALSATRPAPSDSNTAAAARRVRRPLDAAPPLRNDAASPDLRPSPPPAPRSPAALVLLRDISQPPATIASVPAASSNMDGDVAPAATTPAPPMSRATGTPERSSREASTIAAGTTSRLVRWSGTASSVRYTVSAAPFLRDRRSRAAPVYSADHSMHTPRRKAGAYASALVALLQAVKKQPAQIAAAIPHPARPILGATSAPSSANAAADATADSRFVATAVESHGNSRLQLRAIVTYSGVPGGWGMPYTAAAAENSPASQSARSGASVAA